MGSRIMANLILVFEDGQQLSTLVLLLCSNYESLRFLDRSFDMIR